MGFEYIIYNIYIYIHILVGGLEDFLFFHRNFIIPSDFPIFQRGRYTTNQRYVVRYNFSIYNELTDVNMIFSFNNE